MVAEVVGVAALSDRSLLDGNLLSSAPLSPGTLANFEAELVAALDGPAGAVGARRTMTAAGFFMRRRPTPDPAVDQARRFADDVGDRAQGYTLPLQLSLEALAAGLPAILPRHPELADDGLFTEPERGTGPLPDELRS